MPTYESMVNEIQEKDLTPEAFKARAAGLGFSDEQLIDIDRTMNTIRQFETMASHRVIDGVTAARFLADLISGIEAPANLLY